MKEFEEKSQILRDSTVALTGQSDLDVTPDDNTTHDGLPKDLDIIATPEVEAEQLNDASPEQQVVEEEPKKKSDRYAQRKSQLTRAQRKAAEAQAVAQQLAQENEYLRTQVMQQSNYSAIQREQQLVERTRHIQDVLRQAKEEGNIDQELQATNLLSRYNAELVSLKNNRTSAAAPAYYDQPQYYPDYQAPVNPVLEDIVAENDWLDENSDNFDPELAQEATLAETALAKQWRLAGYGQQIGSKEFYNNVVQMVKDRYGIGSSQAPQRQQPSPINSRNMNPQQRYVAPVNRNYEGSNASITQVGNSIKINLTPEQREIARAMTFSDPNLTDQQKENLYARALYKQYKEGR